MVWICSSKFIFCQSIWMHNSRQYKTNWIFDIFVLYFCKMSHLMSTLPIQCATTRLTFTSHEYLFIMRHTRESKCFSLAAYNTAFLSYSLVYSNKQSIEIRLPHFFPENSRKNFFNHGYCYSKRCFETCNYSNNTIVLHICNQLLFFWFCLFLCD